MNKITIQNVGPIKEATLDLNKFNVIMGPQSSGKSTIAKIISYCTWVEKNVATNQSFEAFEKDKNYFRDRLESFHKLKGYFKENSVITYESDVIKLSYTSQDFEIDWVDQYAYKKSKILYIPAERNMIVLPEMEKVELPHTNVRSFLFDWFDARKSYSKENDFPLLNLGVNYYYSEDSKESHIRLADNGNSYDILLSNASSGLQSITPLIVMVDYLTNQIYTQEENISFEQRLLRTKIEREKLMPDLILIPYFGEKAQDVNDLNNKIIALNENIEAKEKKAIELARQYHNVSDNLFKIHDSQLIIEEPEQNLFPETQRDLIYHLVEKCNDEKRNHRLTFTTHSPYILYALDNCMMTGLVWDKLNERDKEKLKCKSARIDPKKVSIYEIREGVLKCIQKEDGLISKNYFDSVMKGLKDDFYVLLNYYN